MMKQSEVMAGGLFLCALVVLLLPVDAYAEEPGPSKDDLITVLNTYLTTFNLDGNDRTGYDPYSIAFSAAIMRRICFIIFHI